MKMRYKTYTVEEWIPYILGLLIFLIVITAFFVGYYVGYDAGEAYGKIITEMEACNCTLQFVHIP